jgi:hypothetical protein
MVIDSATDRGEVTDSATDRGEVIAAGRPCG